MFILEEPQIEIYKLKNLGIQFKFNRNSQQESVANLMLAYCAS